MDDAERRARIQRIISEVVEGVEHVSGATDRILELRATPPAVSELPGISGWLPIESAPKDETEFLAWGSPEGMEICQVVYYEPSTSPDITTADGHIYKGEEWCWAVIDGSTRHRDSFTHWMPLPPAPQPREDEA